MEHQNKTRADLLEQVYVHDVYNRLDSNTLTQDTTAWPNVRKFLHRISLQDNNALVADIGCGTGKYLTLRSDLLTIGCDRSHQLCEIVRDKYAHVPIVMADNLHLPYRDNLFDAVLSISVIHHLANHQRRVQAIRECLRILKSNGGQLLIYTWAMEQKARKFCGQDVLVPCINYPTLSVDKISNENSSPITRFSMIDSIQNLFQRIVKPTSLSSYSTPSTPVLTRQDCFTSRNRSFRTSSYNNEQTSRNPHNKRFYHVFKYGELEALIEEASRTMIGCKIIKSFYDHGNWCAIVQKDCDIDVQ